MHFLQWGAPQLGQLQPLCTYKLCFFLSNHLTIDYQDKREIPGSRGEADFVWKCRSCTVSFPLNQWEHVDRLHMASLIHLWSFVTGQYNSSQTVNWSPYRKLTPLLLPEGQKPTRPRRILHPRKSLRWTAVVSSSLSSSLMYENARHWADWEADWLIKGEWEAKGVDSTTTFSGIDLDEGEWFDYDEKKGEEVSIKDITWTIDRWKKLWWICDGSWMDSSGSIELILKLVSTTVDARSVNGGTQDQYWCSFYIQRQWNGRVEDR